MDGVCLVALPMGDHKIRYNDGDEAPMHQTLVYLGKTKDLTLAQRGALLITLERLAMSVQPFTATVSGLATLGSDGDKVAITEAAELQKLHDMSLQNGIVRKMHQERNEHPTWISHVTTDKFRPGDSITFDRVGLWIGDDRQVLPLGHAHVEKRAGKTGFKRFQPSEADPLRYRIPSELSTPKEIVGHHGHKPHGRSIRWPALYEHLRAKGYTKRKAAMISNGLWRKKRGLPPKSVKGTKGKVGVN